MRPRFLFLPLLVLAALGLALLPRLARKPAPAAETTPALSTDAPAPSPLAASGDIPAPPAPDSAADSAADPVAAAAPAAAAVTASPASPAPPARPRGPLRIPAGAPIPELLPHQAERDAIQAHASTYEAARIPLIAPYLTHADPTVRDAARLGLVQLGDAAAVPHLRAALALATDDDERAALQEAIDFVSLPSSSVAPPSP